MARNYCEEYSQLNIKEIKAREALGEYYFRGMFRAGHIYGELYVHLNNPHTLRSGTYIQYCFNNEQEVLDVPLTYTNMRYGGKRWYFECPGVGHYSCGKRVTILYYRLGEFACRTCHNLVYKKQDETRQNTYLTRIWAHVDLRAKYREERLKTCRKTYRGKPTKQQQKVDLLWSKICMFGYRDSYIFPTDTNYATFRKMGLVSQEYTEEEERWDNLAHRDVPQPSDEEVRSKYWVF